MPLASTASRTSSVMSVTVSPPDVRSRPSCWNVLAASSVATREPYTVTALGGVQLPRKRSGEPGEDALLSERIPMSIRLVVDGAVYILAAREAMRLVRRLRYLRSQS